MRVWPGRPYPLALLRATPAAAVGASATPGQVEALRKEIRRQRMPSSQETPRLP